MEENKKLESVPAYKHEETLGGVVGCGLGYVMNGSVGKDLSYALLDNNTSFFKYPPPAPDNYTSSPNYTPPAYDEVHPAYRKSPVLSGHGLKRFTYDDNKHMVKTNFTENMTTIIGHIEALKEADTTSSQRQHFSPLLHRLKVTMRALDSQKQQYLKYTLLLVKTMILDHSCEKLLEHGQINAMLHVVKNCMTGDVDEKAFLEYNDFLENYGLKMIPAEED